MLTAHHIKASFDDFVLSIEGLHIPESSITGLIGASGSGKTSLLLLFSGFMHAEEGTIMHLGLDITYLKPEKRPITMLFQDHNIFEHLDVRHNILLGIPKNMPQSARQELYENAISLTHLEDFEKRMPHSLSGGQRSRIGLARALVMERPVLLLDEPFAALDPGLRYDLIEDIKTITAQKKLTVILTSHEPFGIGEYCDYFGFMDHGYMRMFDTPSKVLKDKEYVDGYLYGRKKK